MGQTYIRGIINKLKRAYYEHEIVIGGQFLRHADKFNMAFGKEEDVTTPRAKGLLNYKERIKAISKSKK